MRVQNHLSAASRGYHAASRRCLPFLALLLLCIPGHAPAREERGTMQVITAQARRGETAWLLNARLDISLSHTAREALENGVPLVFDFQIQALEKHSWFWDRVIEEHTEVRKIRYHPLSQTYIVKNANTGDLRGFRRLSEAMHALGDLLGVSVLDYREMDADGHYTVRLRGSLDVESLPTPIRLLAYFSPAWKMKSDWYQCPLAR
jgi:hypothetical protein